MDGIKYVRSKFWIRLEVHWLDFLGVVFGSGRVFYSDPKEHFCDGRLGKIYIGLTILDVLVRDTDAIMNNGH